MEMRRQDRFKDEVTSVPAQRDTLRSETPKRYIAIPFVAFPPHIRALSEIKPKSKSAIST